MSRIQVSLSAEQLKTLDRLRRAEAVEFTRTQMVGLLIHRAGLVQPAPTQIISPPTSTPFRRGPGRPLPHDSVPAYVAAAQATPAASVPGFTCGMCDATHPTAEAAENCTHQ